MATISTVEQKVQDRLEENEDSVGIFWDVVNELRPLIVEGMFEATVLTGEPEIRASQVATLVANQNLQSMPTGGLVVIRLESGGGAVQKASVWDLDRHHPGWENDTGAAIKRWYPYGLGQFGIWPKLTASAEVFLTYVGIPVNVAPPYTGAEIIPFDDAYLEAWEDYAAAMARVKEGEDVVIQVVPQINRYMDKMAELSKFAWRKNSLRFSLGSAGAAAGITPVRGK